MFFFRILSMIGYYKILNIVAWASLVAQLVRNLPAMQETHSIPALGGSPEEGNGYPLQYSCLENPWTEEPGGLQSIESQRVRHD